MTEASLAALATDALICTGLEADGALQGLLLCIGPGRDGAGENYSPDRAITAARFSRHHRL